MSVKCPKKLFEFFENSEGCATPDEDGKEFLYQALYEGFQFSDIVHIEIPSLDNKTFNDWGKFEDWCSEIQGLDIGWIVNDEIINEVFNEENDTPKKFFKTKKYLKEKIIKALRTSTPDEIESIMYVEIECHKKKLLLLYFDSDNWTLGFGTSVVVIQSLDELTEAGGYYRRIHE